jgi:hypothetical protein
MKPINGIASFLAVGFAAVLLLACESKMERAKQALDKISYSVATISADGTQYWPIETAHLQQELSDLHSAYARRHYAEVLSRAPAVLTDAKSLAADTAAKRSQIVKALVEQWSGFAATLPQWIGAAEYRIAALSKPKRVPKGVDLSTAASALADAKNGWGRA